MSRNDIFKLQDEANREYLRTIDITEENELEEYSKYLMTMNLDSNVEMEYATKNNKPDNEFWNNGEMDVEINDSKYTESGHYVDKNDPEQSNIDKMRKNNIVDAEYEIVDYNSENCEI